MDANLYDNIYALKQLLKLKKFPIKSVLQNRVYAFQDIYIHYRWYEAGITASVYAIGIYQNRNDQSNHRSRRLGQTETSPRIEGYNYRMNSSKLCRFVILNASEIKIKNNIPFSSSYLSQNYRQKLFYLYLNQLCMHSAGSSFYVW